MNIICNAHLLCLGRGSPVTDTGACTVNNTFLPFMSFKTKLLKNNIRLESYLIRIKNALNVRRDHY